jgi:hypothetical protein
MGGLQLHIDDVCSKGVLVRAPAPEIQLRATPSWSSSTVNLKFRKVFDTTPNFAIITMTCAARPRRSRQARSGLARTWCGLVGSSSAGADELYLRRDLARASEKGTVGRERRRCRGRERRRGRGRSSGGREGELEKCRGMGKESVAVRVKKNEPFFPLISGSGG